MDLKCSRQVRFCPDGSKDLYHKLPKVHPPGSLLLYTRSAITLIAAGSRKNSRFAEHVLK